MKNINLKNNESVKKKTFSAGLSTNLGIVTFLIVFIIYGAIFALNNITEKEIDGVNDSISAIEKSLADSQFNEAYNFGIKVIDLATLSGDAEFLPQTKNIIKISEKTLDQITFAEFSFELDEGLYHYGAEIRFPDYEILAKQVNLYKSSEDIENFFLEEAGKAEESEAADNENRALITFDMVNPEVSPKAADSDSESAF